MSPPLPALRFLFPAWYAVVMGLCGLALAWHRAGAVMGDATQGVTLALGGLAAAVFVALVVATLLRARWHPQTWAEDRRHPVRHVFIAALPVAMLLLATVGVALFGTVAPTRGLWWAGSVGQLFVTWWVLSRWWRDAKAGGGLSWATVTPGLLIPIVGNVVAPLAGVPLGHIEWAIVQFGVGLMFWPVVLVLIIVRLASAGPWPERLRPTAFIVAAPPAVVGLALLQLGTPIALAWKVTDLLR